MKHFKTFFIIISILGCQSNNKEKVSQNSEDIIYELEANSLDSNSLNNNEINQDTIYIDFNSNKKKLEILTLLPDSCFTAWTWTKEERISLYEEVKKKGFYIDRNPEYNNIVKIENNYFLTTVIDGSWEFAIYRINENNYIVITNDIVGDGNAIYIYEYLNNSLKSIQNRQGYFQKPLNELKQTSMTKSCISKLEQENEDAIFRYDFTKLNEVEINNAWGFSIEEYSKCLKGNTIKYRFNPLNKRFDLVETKWNKKEY